jgi:hypothetical protein
VALADASRQEKEWAEQKAREAEEERRQEEAKEAKARAALGDVGRSVDPEFLTALIKAGLGFQGILELLKEMEVTEAKDLQAVKYQDLVDAGLKPIQARKLKAIGMRSSHSVETPKQINIKRTPPPHSSTYTTASSNSSSRTSNDSYGAPARRTTQSPRDETPPPEEKKKKKSMFKRFSLFKTKENKHAAVMLCCI